MNLFPDFPVPDLAETINSQTDSPGTSYLFDFEKGDFVTDAAGKYVVADETQTWMQWCIKAAYTQRGAYMAYSNNYGAENEESFAEPIRDAQQSAFERAITEAILADPYGRTASVSNFDFQWGTDSLNIAFIITSTNGISVPVALTL